MLLQERQMKEIFWTDEDEEDKPKVGF